VRSPRGLAHRYLPCACLIFSTSHREVNATIIRCPTFRGHIRQRCAILVADRRYRERGIRHRSGRHGMNRVSVLGLAMLVGACASPLEAPESDEGLPIQT